VERGDISGATRNGWLRLSNAELMAQCDEEGYKASGPGGQRRNKVETASRVTHRPSGLSAQASDSRSREENRRRALRRLRERIACEVRAPYKEPPEFAAFRRDGKLAVNSKNPPYPIVIATALDALTEATGSFAGAAEHLGISTSQLIKFLQSDREIWRTVSETSF
jgi:hypothetical protein